MWLTSKLYRFSSTLLFSSFVFLSFGQIAPVVGVPKREPCTKCGHPVFLAERLTIGQSLFHRTCLRCARCDTQLTPGSFYETEVDGVFCCETCPDEEKSLSKLRATTDATDVMGNGAVERQSFRDKLAMFQSDGKGLLQKSLSDEEKSKSLKRLNDFLSKQQEQERNDASASLNTVASSNASDEPADDESTSDASSSESDDEAANDSGGGGGNKETDAPPPLPTSQPPVDNTNDINTILQPPAAFLTDVSNITPPSVFQLPIAETPQITAQSIDNSAEASSIVVVSTAKEEIGDNVNATLTPAIDEIVYHDPTNRMPSDALDNFNHISNVTKEQKRQQQHSTGNGVDDNSNGSSSADVGTTATPAIVYRPSSMNMVQSRLSQFEALADGEQKRSSVNWSPRHLNRTSSNGLAVHSTPPKLFSPLRMDASSNPAIDESAPMINNATAAVVTDPATTPNTINADSIDNQHSDNDTTHTDIVVDNNSSYHEPTLSVNTNNDDNKENVTDELRPVPTKRSTREATLVVAGDEFLPTPSKRSMATGDDEIRPMQSAELPPSPPLPPSSPLPTVVAAPSPRIDITATSDKENEKYPDNLNPFGSDDEDGDASPTELRRPMTTTTKTATLKNVDTSNPFDSSDDEIELLKDATPKRAASNNKQRQTAQFRCV